MDIRGIEITNQLRNAIRAKLTELGVRYDEELPDYILVMVVNKKSRQHMNDDLNLFLEDNTKPFVDWLHDQVLKKLQKVTVSKKKSKEIPPLADIKEEVCKKEKDENKVQPIVKKEEKDKEFDELVGDLALLNEDSHDSQLPTGQASNKNIKSSNNYQASSNNSDKNSVNDENLLLSHIDDEFSLTPERTQTPPRTPPKSPQSPTKTPPRNNSKSSIKSPTKRPRNDSVSENNRRESDKVHTHKNQTKETNISKRSSTLEEGEKHSESDTAHQSSKRLKISNNSEKQDSKTKSNTVKSKITSVVTVKSRLGSSSTHNRKSEEKHSGDISKSSTRDLPKSSVKSRIDMKKNESSTLKSLVVMKNSGQNRSGDKTEESHRSRSSTTKSPGSSSKKDRHLETKSPTKITSVKSRLGSIKQQAAQNLEDSKKLQDIPRPRISNVKSRLGRKPLPQNRGETRRPMIVYGEENFDVLDDEPDLLNNVSLKSQIIAIKKSEVTKPKEKLVLGKRKIEEPVPEIEEPEEGIIEEDDHNEEELKPENKLLSKVIQTTSSRPLKPLQPTQRRATQSLLLRAVAEANKSVVQQRKVDPCLVVEERKKVKKPPKLAEIKLEDIRRKLAAKKLSAQENPESKKSVLMERIRIELKNPGAMKAKKPRVEKETSDEDMELVKALFHKNDNQKNPTFLVTLNGYNNNLTKTQKNENFIYEVIEDEDEEDAEDEDQSEDTNQFESPVFKDLAKNENIGEDDNDEFEDHDDDDDDDDGIDTIFGQDRNVPKGKTGIKSGEDDSLKKNKPSPIVYSRSRSSSPDHGKTLSSIVSTASTTSESRKPNISSVITTVQDKSSEKCRYWPNCTMGYQCSYFHPEVPCSTFPNCKFGDKCAYVHPKCKFGSACTKLGCVFSHPPLQCKYHPYCMKPGCPYSHPKTISSTQILEITSQRSKFTWKKI